MTGVQTCALPICFGQAVLVALMTMAGLAPVPAIVVSLTACLTLGILNGILVVRFQINSLIATLAVGIRVPGLIIGAFSFSALLSGVGGVIIASRLSSAQPELGPSFLMPAIASAFLGATTIRPGRFNSLGTVVAVYAVAVIVTGLQQIGVPFWVENVVCGTALATGVGVSGRLTRMREEAARRSQLQALKEGRLAVRPLEAPAFKEIA